ncbi:MAG: LytTR family DNA-binding domain-containing protein [Parashewanella sp.]
MLFTKLHYQSNKTGYEVFMLSVYFFINAGINSTSVLMESKRDGVASLASWEPFVWEYSSALSSLFLLPLIAIFMTKYPWQWKQPKLSSLQYLFAAVVFSMTHIVGMVVFREISYQFTSLEYDFAKSITELGYELIYEIRKDVWSFCTFVILITVYRQVIVQWLGDATCIDETAKSSSKLTKHLLVKKLGKEFLIKTEKIEWMQSAGNYVNLHIGDQVYPTRSTLVEFVANDTTNSLCRIHRSFAINLNFVHCIEPLASGDAEITMLSGHKLRLSRRYKDSFKQLKNSNNIVKK